MKVSKTHILIIIVSVYISVVLAFATQSRDSGNQRKNLSAVTGPEHPVIVIEIEIPHGPVKDGLAAFLMCPRNQFKLGEPIRLMHGILFRGPEWDMAIQPPSGAVNPGLELDAPDWDCPEWDMTIQPPAGFDIRTIDSWLKITGPDGNDVAFTGLIGCRPRHHPKNRLRLFPGSFIGKQSYDIRRFYDLNTPGTYSIEWHYGATHEPKVAEGDTWWVGELVSNEVHIEIVK
jgi:hypothetical protein